MRTVSLRLADVSRTSIPIGYEGEQNHTRVIFYCAQIFDDYPDAVATMVIKPGSGDPYPQTVSQDDGLVIWDVTPSNVANAGSGTYQFTFTDNDEIIKSVIGSYSVTASIVGSGEAPDPIQDWIAETEGTFAKKENAVFTGTFSHQRKSSTTAGDYSVTLGSNNTASGQYAIAEGRTNTASGVASHAEGQGSTASGTESHVGGHYSTSSGSYAFAHGNYAKANHRSQFVFGEFNVEDPSTAASTAKGNYIEIVGNGTHTTSKSNARTLDWDGNESLAGSLTLGKGTANEVTITAAQLTQLLALLN